MFVRRLQHPGSRQMECIRRILALAGILLLGLSSSYLPKTRGEEGVHKRSSSRTCHFPAIYNFGDSNSDTGGISAAFYPAGDPSGETFFHKPAGRGSDGRLIIDFLAAHLGLPFLSSYLDTMGTSYRHGANFATGSSTIRPQVQTMPLGISSPFSLDIQVVQFGQFKSRTTDLFNQTRRKCDRRRIPRPEDFAKAIYTFDIGQNDIARGMSSMSRAQLVAEIPDMVSQLATAIQNVYQQGGRTFWIHNTGPIGCLPVTTHYYHGPPTTGVLDEDGCVREQNELAMEFNRQLKAKVVELRGILPDAALVYVDIYNAKFGLIGTAKQQGFLDPDKICCGYHEDSTHVYCGHKGSVNGTELYAGSCKDPSSHISWDGIHYTDAANRWLAQRVADGMFSDPPVPLREACRGRGL